MKIKKFKRVLAAALSLVMIAGGIMMPAPKKVQAADDSVIFSVTADKKEVKRGDTVQLKISLPETKGLVSLFQANLEYDEDVLQLAESNYRNWTWGVPINTVTVGTKTEGVVKFVYDNYPGLMENGDFVTIPFTVKENAGAGQFGFDLTGIKISDLDGNSIGYNVSNDAKDLTVSIPATAIQLNKTETTIAKGATETLTAALTPEDATSAVTWASDKPDVASVDNNGTVTAVSTGTANITAAANGITASCKVTVDNPLTNIEIVNESGNNTLKKGQTAQLNVKYTPEDATGSRDVTWTSSDDTVAAVDTNGLVTALKDGSTTITAQVGELTADLTITVKEVPLQSIEVDEAFQIHKGETKKLSVTYNPTDTTDDRTVYWSSSESEVASVDGDGNVSAKKPGSTTITARVGNCTDTCIVTVDAPLQAIQPEKDTIALVKGQKAEITYSLVPADTTSDPTVTMESDQEDVVFVEGHTVTAKKAGTAAITLKGANNVTAEVTVEVREIPIEGIVLDQKNLTVEKGMTAELTAVINPEDTTDDDKTITWKSSDPDVVTAAPEKTDSGEKVTVTAVSGGTATITASTANGKTAACEVKVPKHIESIELEGKQELLRGETTNLTVKYNPADTDDDKTVIWESSDPSVASVDETSGMITALKEGTVTITAKTTGTQQEFTAAMELTVKENHLSSIIDQIAFEEMKDAILKGQQVYMNDFLNLNQLMEEYQITDDIEVSWTVGDEKIAAIDSTGCLTGLKEGETTVTATIQAADGKGQPSGNHTVEVHIQVKEIPLESIAFDKVIKEMKVGQKVQLNVLYNPDNTTDMKAVVWETSDKDILTVDQGLLTAKKPGTAEITAKVGDKSVSCKIIVKENQISGGQDSQDSSKGQSQEAGAVQTGDSSHAGITMITLLSALAVIGGVLYLRRKRPF